MDYTQLPDSDLVSLLAHVYIWSPIQSHTDQMSLGQSKYWTSKDIFSQTVQLSQKCMPSGCFAHFCDKSWMEHENNASKHVEKCFPHISALNKVHPKMKIHSPFTPILQNRNEDILHLSSTVWTLNLWDSSQNTFHRI